MSTQLRLAEKRMEHIKQELLALGPMRPGSITKQYRLPKEKRRPFYQISYTHHMRSRSEYVREEDLPVLRKETANFRRFKRLVNRWVDLALAASQLRIGQARENARKTG